MSQINRNEVKKMWFVFTALLTFTTLEIGLSTYKPLQEDTMKWAIIALISAKIIYTISYFIYLKQKKKEIYICHDISFSSHHSIYADCTSDGKRNDKFVIKESIAASENNCQ